MRRDAIFPIQRSYLSGDHLWSTRRTRRWYHHRSNIWWYEYMVSRSEHWMRRALFKRAYNKYLQSPEWEAKRQAVLKRDEYKCVKCGSQDELQVHHLTYDHVYNEPLKDLITLCKKCHYKTHHKRRRYGKVGTKRRMVHRKRTR